MFHIFPLVCFLIDGVKSRSGHDRSQSFRTISHDSNPKLIFKKMIYFTKQCPKGKYIEHISEIYKE